MEVEGKVAIVTGAGGGIGGAISRAEISEDLVDNVCFSDGTFTAIHDTLL
jgi:FlaA1/EpsC-like NDP-sugar epimerase